MNVTPDFDRTRFMSEPLYDVAIVGAGPAGATCAWYLANQDIRVLLLDKAVYPRAGGNLGKVSREVEEKLSQAGIRVKTDDRDEKIGYKIRGAEMEKVPYMLVVGAREAEQGSVSVRAHTRGDLGGRSLADFLQEVVDEATGNQ